EGLEAAGGCPAGVRDQDVEPPEVLRAGVDDPLRLALDREVARQREHAELLGRAAQRLRLARADGDRRALRRELRGDGPAEATARAADERDAALEPEVHRRR